MKTSRYQSRFYRDWGKIKDLHFARIFAKETDLSILTNKKLDEDFVKEKIRSYRWDIESYIDKDRRFLVSLKPITVELNAPPIIKAMEEASRLANAGPMSAVAGAIAQFLGQDLLKKGYKDVIIENGGDIFIKSRKSRIIGIYAGRSKFSKNISLKIRPKDTPLGVCASSGTVGHSLSFGCADCVIILSKSAVVADAAATVTANLIKSKEDLKRALDFALSIKGVTGALAIIGNSLAVLGNIELIK